EGGDQIVHRVGIRGGQYIGVGAFGQLRDQGGGAVVHAGLHGHVRVLLGEEIQQIVHRFGQGGGGEDGQALLTLAGCVVFATGALSTHAPGAAAQGQGEGTGQCGDGGRCAAHQPCSTITVVALTTAVARAPTSRPRSRTASADINDTTRYGPHCRSTCAITSSAAIAVTRPVNRFRALVPLPPVGELARS